ncbi:6-phosphogluconolactonase [Leucobacter sp. Psy1]|uniref:6-phosphogluconolactonase n=1 Tax=Leucobacter sp. Psy1 TaxID=2875729 RepID=UPI001CD24BB3|nr:6-phosphogluconolactonase [Leucobacter sp. Psy1]UBH06089.1 6-phosphogluconolactonase [Leucobacter sp. Psy1]
MRIHTADDRARLAEDLADACIDVLAARQELGEIPCIVLTGGSMGEASLSALGRHPRAALIEWDRVRFLWGDERWVPAGDPERNDRLADELLFSRQRVDGALVHRVPASDSGLSLDDAARSYAELVYGIDRVDVVLCGVGPDGHVASLFPGRDDLLREDGPAALPVRESPKPPPERVTLSLSTLRRGHAVWLLAAGAEKAPAIRGILAAERGLPAALVEGREETVVWADRAALAS